MSSAIIVASRYAIPPLDQYGSGFRHTQGQVLWLTLEMPSQWWNYSSFGVQKNNSGHFRYLDFGVTWRWALLPNQYIVPGAPPCLQDEGTYEIYASLAPGARNWEAWWVHPSRGVTLMPSDKDSDPNALALLLRSEQSGRLHLMFAWQITSNWTSGGFIGDDPFIEPSFLHFSMGVGLLKPVVTPSGAYDVVHKSIGHSKPQRRERPPR
jgi:hypothetical protein